ncbi:hypothetical protein [uncultured Hoeflea sp.]|uniref:hypothetical protein n=1 Tax=uncultured Hoeflea sp. TaxID=538666 RepID=UPI002638FEE6|nr:hypothetical protein [uncultured Hoeflea sp.]
MPDQSGKEAPTHSRDRDTHGRSATASGTDDSLAIEIDWDFCIAMLEGSDMANADKRVFVECMFSIVLGFVDLGFGLHPLQQTDADGDIASLAKANSAGIDDARLRHLIGVHVLGVEDTPPLSPEAGDGHAVHRRDFADAADRRGDNGDD